MSGTQSSCKSHPRKQKLQIAQKTLSICDSGTYVYTRDGRDAVDVSISSQLAQAIQGTVLYRPSDELPAPPRQKFATKITVRNEYTLAGARRLAEHYSLLSSGDSNLAPVAVLNFASAKNPGGGFLRGATAQEECLARCSALYKCQIKFQEDFYDWHQRTDEVNRLCLYTSSIIYSPGVPVFRASDHSFLAQPFPVSFLTCPAVNMSNAERVGVSWDRGRQAMVERATRVLDVMCAHGHKHIVLGAWGCGVFRNPPEDVADIFLKLLGPGGQFEGVFEEIAFSVLDSIRNQANVRAFKVLEPLKQQ
jgi:uncharacterized protein (TIGR02452 family)